MNTCTSATHAPSLLQLILLSPPPTRKHAPALPPAASRRGTDTHIVTLACELLDAGAHVHVLQHMMTGCSHQAAAGARGSVTQARFVLQRHQRPQRTRGPPLLPPAGLEGGWPPCRPRQQLTAEMASERTRARSLRLPRRSVTRGLLLRHAPVTRWRLGRRQRSSQGCDVSPAKVRTHGTGGVLGSGWNGSGAAGSSSCAHTCVTQRA